MTKTMISHFRSLALLVATTAVVLAQEPTAPNGKTDATPAGPEESAKAKRMRERRNKQAAPAPGAKAGEKPMKEGNALDAKALTPEEQLKMIGVSFWPRFRSSRARYCRGAR